MLRFLGVLGRGIAWVAVLAIVAGGTLFIGRGFVVDENEGESAAAPLPVAVMEVRYQDTYEQERRFSGRILAAQVADVSFEVAGEIDDVLVEVGDLVEEGAVLARLDPVRLDIRASEAAAQLAEARAVFATADASRDRVVNLLGQGFATEQELDNADAERNAARERVRALERSLARAQEDLEDTTLRAPFAGYVVGRYIDGGTVVQVGQPIVRINQKAELEAEISIPTELARYIEVGDRFPLATGDREADGVVRGISEDVDRLTRSRKVRLAIEQDPGFVPGTLVRIGLTQERRGTGVWVPTAALQEGYRGLWSVYVVVEEGNDQVIRRKDVEIISIGDGRVFVTGTLEDGDQVVTTSPFRFVPGQKVEIKTNIAPGTSASAASSSILR
ncbi:MAG: efflux RND transporter periplasmic adaptor subunit [Pseudomonadota bacterium]